MKDMKRVALMTIYKVPNYGSVLQAYATVRVLGGLGFDCDVINYTYPNAWHYRQGTTRFSHSLLHRLAVRMSKAIGLKKHHVFLRRLEKFRKKHFRLTKPMASLDELGQYDWSQYHAVIAGSDQIWNPRFLHGDSAFMLSFVPDNVKKISIASSFAAASVPQKLRAKYKKHLGRFSSITVREANGKQVAEKELQLPLTAGVIPDPTLLLSAPQWKKLFDLTGEKAQKPYILLYLLDYAFDPKPYIFEVVNHFHKKYGLEIKTIYKFTSFMTPYLRDYTDCQDASPMQFVRLVGGASLVVTSSFHGTAFAVNFARPLIAVVPGGGDDRQTTLLRSLGLEKCALRAGADYDMPIEYWDTGPVQNRLQNIRQQAIDVIAKDLE